MIFKLSGSIVSHVREVGVAVGVVKQWRPLL